MSLRTRSKRRRVEEEDIFLKEDDEEEEDEEEDEEYTDIPFLLQSPTMLENIMTRGIVDLLGNDAPSKKIIEKNVKAFISSSSSPSSGRCETYQSKTIIERLEQEIEEEKPTLEKIASSNLSLEDKKYCLKLYKIFDNTDPLSEDYIRLEQHLINKIKYGKIGSPEEIQHLNQVEKELKEEQVEIYALKEKILSLDVDKNNKSIIYKKYLDFEVLSPSDSNYQTIKEWLDWAIKLPFNHSKPILPPNKSLPKFLGETRCHFDKKIYGMKRVKDEILLFLHDLHNGVNIGKNILLEGKIGVGKTLVAKACSEALEWPFYRISCGGLEDPSFIRGQSTAWVGSSPSIFVNALCAMKCKNGIILLDEIDKMNERSQEALLDVVDHTTNREWRDGFLKELSLDMRGLLLIASANDSSRIIAPLRDRFESITIPSYSVEEKYIILNDYMHPAALELRSLPLKSIKFHNSAIYEILNIAGEGGGMREVKMILFSIIARIHLLASLGTKSKDLRLGFSLKFSSFPVTLRAKDIKTLYGI